MCYVDEILCISHDPGIVIVRIQAVFKFKGDHMEQPKIYIRDQVGKMLVYGAESC